LGDFGQLKNLAFSKNAPLPGLLQNHPVQTENRFCPISPFFVPQKRKKNGGIALKKGGNLEEFGQNRIFSFLKKFTKSPHLSIPPFFASKKGGRKRAFWTVLNPFWTVLSPFWTILDCVLDTFWTAKNA
jgi:hypothetical protein